MSGRKSKNKGSNFEREIARLLSGMWDPKLDLDNTKAKDLPFSRTPYSGADKRYPLDIVAPSDYPWLLELKKQEKVLTVEQLLISNSPIVEWFTKAEADAKEAKSKKPVMVIAARNHVKPIVAMRANLDVMIPSTIKHMYVSLGDGTDILIMSLDSFIGLGKEFWIDIYA